MVELIESAASAVSSTAAVIIVTVWACNSIAWRMRSAEVWTSSTVRWIEPLASTVWRVACWMAVILAVMSSVARAVWAGEALHFLRDDREAAAGIAGARRLDGRVEREQVGLAGDVADQAEDRFDRLDVARQRLADLDRLLGLVAGAGGDAGRDLDFGPGVLDRADQARGGLRRFAHRDRRLLGGGRDFARLAEHSAGRRGGRAGALAQRIRLAGAGRDQVGDVALELARFRFRAPWPRRSPPAMRSARG